MLRDAFVAISDPTRREILELLSDREVLAAGDIATAIARVSRPAISRHLRVLRECGLVSSFKHGKTQNYALNPEPIEDVQRWLTGFSRAQVRSLKALREIVESNP